MTKNKEHHHNIEVLGDCFVQKSCKTDLWLWRFPLSNFTNDEENKIGECAFDTDFDSLLIL